MVTPVGGGWCIPTPGAVNHGPHDGCHAATVIYSTPPPLLALSISNTHARTHARAEEAASRPSSEAAAATYPPAAG